MVDGLVESEAYGGASGDSVCRRSSRVCLRAGVATDVVAVDVGDRAVVVGVESDVLVVVRAGAIGDQVRPAVVGQGRVSTRQ